MIKLRPAVCCRHMARRAAPSLHTETSTMSRTLHNSRKLRLICSLWMIPFYRHPTLLLQLLLFHIFHLKQNGLDSKILLVFYHGCVTGDTGMCSPSTADGKPQPCAITEQTKGKVSNRKIITRRVNINMCFRDSAYFVLQANKKSSFYKQNLGNKCDINI